MFFELIFIVWILGSFYRLRNQKESFKENNKKRNKRVIEFDENKGKENEEYKRLGNILIEMKNVQQNICENFIRELRKLSKEKIENIVKVREFYGRDEENPVEWIEEFNRIADANNWKNDRKLLIAAAYLRETAAEWYEDDKENILQWDKMGKNDSFEERFIEKFLTTMKISRQWGELLSIKQKEGETVNSYAERFRKNARRIKGQMNDSIRSLRFTKGLLPEIYVLTILGDRSTLDNAIETAMRAEDGILLGKNEKRKNDKNVKEFFKRKGNLIKRKRKQRCYNCKRKGHISTECNMRN